MKETPKTRAKGTAHKPGMGLSQGDNLFPQTGGTVRYTLAAALLPADTAYRLTNESTKQILIEGQITVRPAAAASAKDTGPEPYNSGFYATDRDEMRVIVQLSDQGMMDRFVYGPNRLLVTSKGPQDGLDVEMEAFDVVLEDFSYATSRSLAAVRSDAEATESAGSSPDVTRPPEHSADLRGRWLTHGVLEGEFMNLSQSGRKHP